MRAAAVFLLILLGVGLIWMKSRRDSSAPLEDLSGQISQVDLPSVTHSDAAEVFRKAFWRNPSDEDEILHAERREWIAEGHVRKWQWFLEVDASPELLKYLRDENSFDLTRATNAPPIEQVPDWFSPDSSAREIYHSSEGDMILMFSKEGSQLFAMGAGGGFRSGAPEVSEQTTLSTPYVEGRLPPKSPPHPEAK
jgi:hypothetical protein